MKQRRWLMKTAWLTYAWDDNDEGDIDFIAQELQAQGLKIVLDRWTIGAGRSLWQQVAHFITSPSENDGWIWYATQRSLLSPACGEEYDYALGRALDRRGGNYPVIGLFPSDVDQDLIPSGIKSRLHVSTADPNWKERIISAFERRAPSIPRPEIHPFFIRLHRPHSGEYIFEVRPRAGSWQPFFAGIPVSEKDDVAMTLRHGAAGSVPGLGSVFIGSGSRIASIGCGEELYDEWISYVRGQAATPTQSFYVVCRQPPSLLSFGVFQGEPLFCVGNPGKVNLGFA
jgi:hypothetical protein